MRLGPYHPVLTASAETTGNTLQARNWNICMLHLEHGLPPMSEKVIIVSINDAEAAG